MSVMRIKKVVTKLGMLHKESWSKKKKTEDIMTVIIKKL